MAIVYANGQVMDGSGTDDAVRPLHALGQVADDHFDAQTTQMLHGGALVHVRTGNDHPTTVQHLSQRRHGHAADANQMGAAAGTKIAFNMLAHFKIPHSAAYKRHN